MREPCIGIDLGGTKIEGWSSTRRGRGIQAAAGPAGSENRTENARRRSGRPEVPGVPQDPTVTFDFRAWVRPVFRSTGQSAGDDCSEWTGQGLKGMAVVVQQHAGVPLNLSISRSAGELCTTPLPVSCCLPITEEDLLNAPGFRMQ